MPHVPVAVEVDTAVAHLIPALQTEVRVAQEGRAKPVEQHRVVAAALPVERTVSLSAGGPPFLTFLLLPAETASQLRKRGRLTAFLRAALAAIVPRKRPAGSDREGRMAVLLSHPHGRGVGARAGDVDLSAAVCLAGGAVVGAAHVPDDTASVVAHIAAAVRYAQRGSLRRDGADADLAALTEPQCKAKTSVDWAAGYRAMLSEVGGMSDRRARAVQGVFPTMDALLVAAATNGPGLSRLEDVPEGGTSGRRFGTALVDRLVEAVASPLDTTAL